MFSFFKRKKSSNISRDESLAKIVEIVAKTLDVQRSVLTDQRLEGDKGIKYKALGYLYGYTDAALHVAGFDTSDASVSVITQALAKAVGL